MEKNMQLKQALDTLPNETADHLLRKIFMDAGFSAESALPATDETRLALSEAINEIGAEPDLPAADTESIVKQSLQVFAMDPLMEDFLVPGKIQEVKDKPRHFNIDATSFISTTTLALVVLSTYINVKRDAEGKWTFQFRIKNSSDALKKEIVNLARKIVGLLPGK